MRLLWQLLPNGLFFSATGSSFMCNRIQNFLRSREVFISYERGWGKQAGWDLAFEDQINVYYYVFKFARSGICCRRALDLSALPSTFMSVVIKQVECPKHVFLANNWM